MKYLYLILLFCPMIAMTQSLSKMNYSELDEAVYKAYDEGDYYRCIEISATARQKALAEFGKKDSIYQLYSSNLGFFYSQTGQYKKALPITEETCRANAEILGETHPDYAIDVNNLALLYQKMGWYDKAMPLFHKAKKIIQQALGEDHVLYANAMTNLGGIYSTIGSYDEALSYYRESSRIYEKIVGKEDPDYAASLDNLAWLYMQMGRFEEAEQLNIEAKNIKEKVLGNEHYDYATSLNNLANIYYQTEKYEQSLKLYLQAKSIYKATLGERHPLYAESLNNLASLYQRMKEYDKAEALYLETIKIRAKVYGKENPAYSTALNNLSSLFIITQQYEKALSLSMEAVAIDQRMLGEQHPDYLNSLNKLVLIHLKMNNYSKDWTTIHQFLQASTRLEMSTDITESWKDSILHAQFTSNLQIEELVDCLDFIYELLKLEQKKDFRQQQVIVAGLAAALLKEVRDSHSGNADKLRMLSRSRGWLLKSLQVLDKKTQTNEAFQLAEQNKSVLLLESIKAEKAHQLSDLPDSVAYLEQNYYKEQSSLQAQLLELRSESEKDSLRAELNQLNLKISNFVQEISQKYPRYAKMKFQPSDINTKMVQQMLEPDAALVEYILGEKSLYIFYIDQQQVKLIEKPIGHEELKAQISIYHDLLSNYARLTNETELVDAQYRKLAWWFYQQLLQDVLIDTKEIKKLILIPDAELGHLPFETLLMEVSKPGQNYQQLHYLLNDFQISYNYAAVLWKENKEAAHRKNNGQLLAMAADYSGKTAGQVRSPIYTDLRSVLQELPAAKTEVAAISKSFKGFTGYGTDATERIFKEKAADFAIIHLAMHGLLDNNRPMLSCLAFTEDGDSSENNFLHAYEISKMQLNADLVVLSACETGFGKFEMGNGIASLARAFMYAGSRSLIVSLWQVNDQATAVLMQHFYQNLAGGMNKAEALRQAKLQYIKSAKNISAHPAFWSPFILIGDDAPIQLSSRQNAFWLWLALVGGGLLLLAAAALIFRKRLLTKEIAK